MSNTETTTAAPVLVRTTLSAAGFILLIAALIFVPAGLAWRRGWLFLLVFVALGAASSIHLWRVNPEIFAARSRIHQGTKPWDIPLVLLIVPSFFAVFLIAGLDARYGWSAVPLVLTALGYALFAVGFALSTWVYAVNKFAEPSVRIQAERGHQVIDTGPYAIVRHPLYIVSMLMIAGMPLALGSYWALIPVGFGTLVLILRTALEDRTLQRELAGYRDYAARVRYRLIPGVW